MESNWLTNYIDLKWPRIIPKGIDCHTRVHSCLFRCEPCHCELASGGCVFGALRYRYTPWRLAFIIKLLVRSEPLNHWWWISTSLTWSNQGFSLHHVTNSRREGDECGGDWKAIIDSVDECMQLFAVYVVDASNLWADHSREESDGQDSSVVQRSIVIVSNQRHTLGHYRLWTFKAAKDLK